MNYAVSKLYAFILIYLPAKQPFATRLEGFMKMEADELKTKIEEEEQKIKDAEETFKTELDKLQKQYEQLSKDKEATIAGVKDGGLGMMKSVLKHQQKNKDEL